jgi:hypothetical protein
MSRTRKNSRQSLLQEADRILKADNDNRPQQGSARFRGGRPAWNWLAKQNEHGAACLWIVARQRLPQPANDNRADASGMGLDLRASGKPRGRNPAPRSLDAYLAMPGIQPRLGDGPPAPTVLQPSANFSEEPRITIKPQEWLYPDAVFTEATRFGYCAPVIAKGASFIGALSGLGQPRPNTNRGDIRRVEEPELPAPPDEVGTVIEAILARATVADVGEALGAKGGYADRRGGKALLAAARWAVGIVEGAKLRHAAPGGATATATAA